MKKPTAKQLNIWLFAAVLFLAGGILFSRPAGALAQTVTDTPTATQTATATATVTGTQTITGTVTGTQTITGTVTTTGTMTGTVTPGTPTQTATVGFGFATRTPTVSFLIPSTGGELSRPSVLGETAGTGTFVALWLVGLLLVGYSLWARKGRQ